MNDKKIIELYWARDERAIPETDAVYGRYCYAIAYNVLSDHGESEECVNDTYLGAWNSMPPHRPDILSAFLGKITRRLSIDRWRERTAAKRGGATIDAALEELSFCIPGSVSAEREVEARELERLVDGFVHALPETERRVFLRRYWYMDSLADISRSFGFSQAKVKSMLHRTRQKLKKLLEKEGWQND